MEPTASEKSLDLHRGLFLVRYEAADDSVHPPTVTVSTDLPSSHISIISCPGFDDGVMWSPGASLVVRAMQSGRLRVAVAPSVTNGSTGARIQLVPLSSDPADKQKTQRTAEVAPTVDLASLRLVGHVAGLGDISVAAGEWIAGPNAPSRIEGITLDWPTKPRGLDLRYAVRVGGPQPQVSPLVNAGTFAGTRGRALPLVGATIEISGPLAATHQLAVDAMFLGSPQMRVSGQSVVVSGPTGREPLVGFRVEVESLLQQKKPVQKVRSERPKRVQPAKPNRLAESGTTVSVTRPLRKAVDEAPQDAGRPAKSGRVRVFRSARLKGL